MNLYYGGQIYDDFKLASMSFEELAQLSVDVQSSIQQTAQTKRFLSRTKKNPKKLTQIEGQLSVLVQLSNKISHFKRRLRDTMQRERDWYHKFFDEAMKVGGKKAKDVVATTNSLMGYELNK